MSGFTEQADIGTTMQKDHYYSEDSEEWDMDKRESNDKLFFWKTRDRQVH